MHKDVPSRTEGLISGLTIAKIIVVALHLVGIIGLSLPEYRWLFLMLTPFQLLSSMILILIFHRGWNDAFPIFAAAAFWLGFGSELIGIHTGYLYGDYVYGVSLGPKLWDVPIVIGVNWFILVYLTGAVFHKSIPNDYYGAFLGAVSMTALDYVMEPVAVALDFWSWKFDIIPPENYLGWFLVSFLIHLIYRKAKFEKENRLAPILLVCLILFFGILNLTLKV
ncbi:MAG: carotenoid biosynthesis protein [Algoriphagus sp.]|nr:carotenoid biosynthesis protein [Algoriphagus sp.]